MSVYGDMLAFFPEQSRTFPYFSMRPNTVASYDSRVDLGVVKGVFQYVKKGDLRVENESLADVDIPTIWTRKKLNVGNFIEVDDVVFRISSNYPWMFEAGFYCFTLETVVGNTDTQTPHPYVNLGQGGYL